MVDILILFQDDAEEIATRIAWAAAERGYSVWGDPNHFASAPDEEIEAAAKGARAVAILWSARMVEDASKRAEAFSVIHPRRAASAMLQLGLEPPAPWRDRPNLDLSRAEFDAAAVDGFVEQIARAAGSPSSSGGEAAVDRLRAAEEEAASWRAIRDLQTPEVFEAYLDRFGKKGMFASLARKRRVAARAARIAAGEDGASGETKNNLMIWAGGGALAATVAFGLLALVTGGDLRKLSGQPTEDLLALQSATEYSADLDAELIETQETLNSAQEALEERNLAVAELEMALAQARGGGEGSAEGEGARLAEMAERQATLEKELSAKEQALAAASKRLTAAQTSLAEARERVAAATARPTGPDGEALERELEASRAETRRANRVLEAARLRIEALEAERSALTAQAAQPEAATQPAIAAERKPAPTRSAALSTPVRVESAVEAAPQAAASEVAASPEAQPVRTAETVAAVAPDPDSFAPASAPIPRPRPAR